VRTALSAAPHAVGLHQGKILAVGAQSTPNYAVLVRYNLDGSLDSDFGNSGIVVSGNIGSAHGASFAIQEDGKIVVAADAQGTSGPGWFETDFGVERYNTDGSLDETFGQNGFVHIGTLSSDEAYAVAIQPDGKIVVGGFSWSSGQDNFSVLRLNPDGSLDDGGQYDTTPGDQFGSGGLVLTPILDAAHARSLVIQSDDKIVLTGNASDASGSFIALARYNPDGTLDETFGEPAPPPPGITVTPTSGLVTSEDGGTASFSVVLDSQPSADVTIPVSSDDSTEGTASVSSLTFTAANWDMPQTVTMTGVDDLDADGNVAYTVVLGAATSTDPAYSGLNAADVSLTNLDNEGQSNVFISEDVPKTIADPHPVKGVKPVTSQLVIASTGITVDLIDVDLTIAHASMSDLTVKLKSPSNTTADLLYDGANWNLMDPAAFSGESLNGTWVLTVTDTVKNGITGTLTAWSMTVTPLAEGAASQGEVLSAVDLFFLDLALNSDNDETAPLATQSADDLALLMME
jgi:uncharacterized delta-60 repeat protein